MYKRKLSVILLVLMQMVALNLFAQNTPPSCVITSPHCNASFQTGTDVTIRVYSTDMGGTYTAGSVTKVEFFRNNFKIGEAQTSTSNTYTFVWKNVPAGTYRITAKATDNLNEVSTSAGVLISVNANAPVALGLSAGKGKYLANLNGYNRADFATYWNGVTAENSCKWGSVEATRDVMVFTSADKAYLYAKSNYMPFRYHALAWGSQYPSWITTLAPADFQAEMEEYMAAIAARYTCIDQIDVLNENIYINSYNKKEHAPGTPYFRAGLGGPGVTGYDWLIWLFQKARQYFPNSKLVMNDYELESNSAALEEMLSVIKVLRDRNLIDGIGTQAHYVNIDGVSYAKMTTALNNMAKSGLPIYVTEMDMKGKTVSEAGQLLSYQTAFPAYWEHPAVAGITLWGYVEGSTWAAGTGLLNADGTERQALTWLKSYISGLPSVGYPFGAISSANGIAPVSATGIRIYPNPAKDFIQIQGLNEGAKTEIFNTKGELVIRTSNNSKINISSLSPGLYFLKTDGGKTVKFIKKQTKN